MSTSGESCTVTRWPIDQNDWICRMCDSTKRDRGIAVTRYRNWMDLRKEISECSKKLNRHQLGFSCGSSLHHLFVRSRPALSSSSLGSWQIADGRMKCEFGFDATKRTCTRLGNNRDYLMAKSGKIYDSVRTARDFTSDF